MQLFSIGHDTLVEVSAEKYLSISQSARPEFSSGEQTILITPDQWKLLAESVADFIKNEEFLQENLATASGEL